MKISFVNIKIIFTADATTSRYINRITDFLISEHISKIICYYGIDILYLISN